MATPVTTAVPAAPLCERRDADGVASLTFNRPQQYNALSLALLEELESAIDAIAGGTDAMLRNLATEDAAEGIDAFVQKRPPRWQNQ